MVTASVSCAPSPHKGAERRLCDPRRELGHVLSERRSVLEGVLEGLECELVSLSWESFPHALTSLRERTGGFTMQRALLYFIFVLVLSSGLVACRQGLREPASDTGAGTASTEAKTLRSEGSFSTGFFSSRTELLAANPSLRRYGIAVSDLDLDGDFEAIVAGHSGPNEVWDWREGAVVEVTPPGIADSGRRAIGVAACDVTGDGAEEVYFLNIDQFGGLGEVSDRLYRREGSGWVDLFEVGDNASALNQFSGRSVACLDRDSDGKYGVFVANYGGPMKLFESSADGGLSDQAQAAGVGFTTGGRALVYLPLGGAEMELFAGNENGPNFAFENLGDGTFGERAEELGLSDPFETVRGATVLDADDDGDFDLVYGNWEGPHRLWLRGDDGTFTDHMPQAMGAPSRIRTVIAADFDNDGYEELFWNNIGEPNRLFRRGPDGWEAADIGDALEPTGHGTGAAVLDLDGDGTLELIIAHGETESQPLTLYVTAPNDNHALRVFVRTAQGAPARGAEVVIEGGARSQRRIIDAGSGYLCQMEPVAHFGLGAEPEPPLVRVTWPGGHTWTGRAPAVDGTLSVERSGETAFVPFKR